jgi:hypothetical protein
MAGFRLRTATMRRDMVRVVVVAEAEVAVVEAMGLRVL